MIISMFIVIIIFSSIIMLFLLLLVLLLLLSLYIYICELYESYEPCVSPAL